MGKNVKKTYTDPETGKFTTDNPGGGRPKGQRNYTTIYREALKKIADSQGMAPEEIEELMLQSGLKKAIKGDYAFYRDTLDRLHGKPLQRNEHSGKDGGPIELTTIEKEKLESVKQLLDD